jgi:hypothetical protein
MTVDIKLFFLNFFLSELPKNNYYVRVRKNKREGNTQNDEDKGG